MKVLVVEDDELTTQLLVKILTSQRYTVDVAEDGQMGWEFANSFSYDLIILNVILPKIDGLSLCQKLRSQNCQSPILLLTDKGGAVDRITGLDAGADDYLIKPFDPEELLARIRVVLRRGSKPIQSVLEWGRLCLNPTSCEVTYEGKVINLTPKEYQLLELFLRNGRRVFSRSAILENIWPLEESPNEGTVTTHIMSLRQKLKAADAAADLIETVYGLGYRLKWAEPPQTFSTKPSGKTEGQEQQKALAAMTGVWEELKDKVKVRLGIFDQLVLAIQSGNSIQELQQQAIEEAHKLAGSLGSFGFAKGSALARQLEVLLQQASSEQGEQNEIVQLLSDLYLELEQPPNQTASPTVSKDFNPLVLMIDGDRTLFDQTLAEARNWGINLQTATDLASARRAIALLSPDAVLLDLLFSGNLEEGFSLLTELAQQTPPIPTLVLTASNSLDARLEAVRLGSSAFLQKPIAPTQIFGAVNRVLKPTKKFDATILAVDDNLDVLETIRSFLEAWGFRLIALSDPHQFWTVLQAANPSLLILDVAMPEITGIELCQVVRNDPRWHDLPILFFTAHDDNQIVREAFRSGADDFIVKPVQGSDLVSRVINRLQRNRHRSTGMI